MRFFQNIILKAVFAIAFATAAGASDALPKNACIDAIQIISRETNVPADILFAIALTETGKSQHGHFLPWPWAINVSGKGEYFQTSTALSDRAVALKNASRRNFDVGCFQINYRWHGHRFQTIDQMIDPISNTRYAAAFLSRLKAEGGSWDYAIGAYHSRTQHHAARYRKVVAKHRKGISKWVAESRQARPKHSALDNKKEHRQIKQAPPLGGVAQSYPKAARLSVKSAGSLFK